MDQTDRALERLRAADPATDLDGEWAGFVARDMTAALRTEPLPSRRRNALLAAAGAAVLVAGIAFAATQIRSSSTTPAAEGTGLPTTSHPLGPGLPSASGDPKERTEALVAELLAQVPVLPGATAADGDLQFDVDPITSGPSSPNLVVEDRYWTAPGSVDDALAYFRAHMPDGLNESGTGTASNDHTGASAEMLMFDTADTDYARGIDVQLGVTAYQGGVGVHADVQAVWIPTRDPATVLADVASVDVTITRTDGDGSPTVPTVTRTLDGAYAHALVEAVNRLRPADPGLFGRFCSLNITGTATDELDIPTSAGTVRVVNNVTRCFDVVMTLPDGTTHAFDGGDLDATLMDVLGLPKDYGRS